MTHRQNETKGSGLIRRNSPVHASQQFSKFSQEFLKERMKNRQKIQNRMKNLNTKLYSSQSDLLKSMNPEDSNPQTAPLQLKPSKYLQRKYIEQKQEPKQIKSQMNQDSITQLLSQLKQNYEKEIFSLKRTLEMKLKAMDQVVNGKDKIIKQMQIQNGVLKTQLSRLEDCLKSTKFI